MYLHFACLDFKCARSLGFLVIPSLLFIIAVRRGTQRIEQPGSRRHRASKLAETHSRDAPGTVTPKKQTTIKSKYVSSNANIQVYTSCGLIRYERGHKEVRMDKSEDIAEVSVLSIRKVQIFLCADKRSDWPQKV